MLAENIFVIYGNHMQFVEILLVLVIIVLAALSSFLFFYYTKINKVISLFLEKGKIRDSKELLFSQIEKTKELETTLGLAIDRVKLLEDTAKISLQKIGVVRFNPFGDMGGNQSFTIALLDSLNNGFVISSLFTKEGNRVYAKAIAKGESKHILSNEEKEAIARAIQ